MEILKTKKEFIWYKKKIDLAHQIEFIHQGEPKKYPCKVHTTKDYETDCSTSYGASDQYNHFFVYQEERVCDKCGHKKSDWPSKQSEDLIKEM